MADTADRHRAGRYIKQEAVFSSQIEGTQSTLEDVLEYEAGPVMESITRLPNQLVLS